MILKTKLMLALACAGILAACAQQTPSVVESRYNMRYSFTDLNDSGVVQVFDDGNRTYLQYRTTVNPDATPSITVPDTHLVMKAHRTGNYWVVDGVFSTFYVVMAGRPALVNNDTAPSVLSIKREAATAATALDRVRKLLFVDATGPMPPSSASDIALGRASSASPGEPHVHLASLDDKAAVPLSVKEQAVVSSVADGIDTGGPTLTVHFSGGSTSLSKAEQVNVAVFALKAKEARSLVVRGFSGFEASSEKAVALASGRAIALRWALLHEGVDPNKTKMLYKSFGGFVGDPKTAEGRAANRRAEAVLNLGDI
jgi:outer membrane protein OmpA-like peptidoglycan-associated protein